MKIRGSHTRKIKKVGKVQDYEVGRKEIKIEKILCDRDDSHVGFQKP